MAKTIRAEACKSTVLHTAQGVTPTSLLVPTLRSMCLGQTARLGSNCSYAGVGAGGAAGKAPGLSKV